MGIFFLAPFFPAGFLSASLSPSSSELDEPLSSLGRCWYLVTEPSSGELGGWGAGTDWGCGSSGVALSWRERERDTERERERVYL